MYVTHPLHCTINLYVKVFGRRSSTKGFIIVTRVVDRDGIRLGRLFKEPRREFRGPAPKRERLEALKPYRGIVCCWECFVTLSLAAC